MSDIFLLSLIILLAIVVVGIGSVIFEIHWAKKREESANRRAFEEAIRDAEKKEFYEKEDYR